MKHILVITDTRTSLESVFPLIQRNVHFHYFITAGEIDQVLTLEDLSVYDLIILSPIDWRIPKTTKSIAEHFRQRFGGTIVGISDFFHWRASMEACGCDHVLNVSNETALFLHNLLFPPHQET